MNQLQIPLDKKIVKKTILTFWQNPRIKSRGGLGLTPAGFEAFKKANIKNYHIKFDEKINFDAKMILGLDNFINSPFYVNKNEIWVFDESTAIQLVLFGGNIQKYVLAKYRKNKSLT